MIYQVKDSNAEIVATVTTKDADTTIDLAEGYTSTLVDDESGSGGGGPDPRKPD